MKLLALMACLSSSLFAAELTPPSENTSGVRVVTMENTPEPDHVELRLVFPESGSVQTKSPVTIQIRVESYALGVDSDFDRKKEIANSPKGQSIHIVVDNHPYFVANEALIEAFDDNQPYNVYTVDIKIPFTLRPGMHTIRAFPVRSFNESLKGDKCFVSDVFYYGVKKETDTFDPNSPYLTYNEPRGSYTGKQPILLDFYLCNARLSRDGYKVRLTIDGTVARTLTQWVPYYIYGLKKGDHTIKLELLDANNKVVEGTFNTVAETISVR